MNRVIAADPLWRMVAVAAMAVGLSAIRPADYFTWAFELGLGMFGVLALVLLRARFRFSPLVYYAVATHFVILAIGAHFTYEKEPLFSWISETFQLGRNHFDRVGHFMQGVTPALITRELLLRTTTVRGWLLAILTIAVPEAFSAMYEILEWLWVAAFYPEKGSEWLGMQGDPFDAQADMLMALCGALTVVIFLARWQDRSIALLTAQAKS